MKNILLFLFFCLPYVSSACSCGYQSMKKDFKEADVVVKATVFSLADTVQYDLYSNPIKPPFTYGYMPIFMINKVYKGSVKSGRKVGLTADYGMCNYYFGLGKTYIIFLYKTKKAGYETSVCTSNFSLDDKKKMAEFRSLE